MPTKREITIRFVTAQGTKISSIVNAISNLADDVTISCKVLSRTTEQGAAKGGAASTSRRGTEPVVDDEPTSNHPQLVYTADLEAKHRRYIDVEASLKRVGLTRQQLMSHVWPRGSPQHRLKRAAVHKSGAAANGALP